MTTAKTNLTPTHTNPAGHNPIATPFGLACVSATSFRAHLDGLAAGSDLAVLHRGAYTLFVDNQHRVRALVKAARLDDHGESVAPVYHFDLDGCAATAPIALRCQLALLKCLGVAKTQTAKFLRQSRKALQRRSADHNAHDATPAIQWHRVRLTAA